MPVTPKYKTGDKVEHITSGESGVVIEARKDDHAKTTTYVLDVGFGKQTGPVLECCLKPTVTNRAIKG